MKSERPNTPYYIILENFEYGDTYLERAAGNTIANLGAAGYAIVKCDESKLIRHADERGVNYFTLPGDPQ